MKKIVLTGLAMVLLFGVNSCCTKKDCEDDEIFEINFYNFSQADLDTITIISYSKNSNFTSKIDSEVTQAILAAGFFSANTINRINTDLDYKINLVSTGQVFTLTGFEIEKEGCNFCFP